MSIRCGSVRVIRAVHGEKVQANPDDRRGVFVSVILVGCAAADVRQAVRQSRKRLLFMLGGPPGDGSNEHTQQHTHSSSTHTAAHTQQHKDKQAPQLVL